MKSSRFLTHVIHPLHVPLSTEHDELLAYLSHSYPSRSVLFEKSRSFIPYWLKPRQHSNAICGGELGTSLVSCVHVSSSPFNSTRCAAFILPVDWTVHAFVGFWWTSLTVWSVWYLFHCSRECGPSCTMLPSFLWCTIPSVALGALSSIITLSIFVQYADRLVTLT